MRGKILGLILVLFSFCGCYDRGGYGDSTSFDVVPNASIADLASAASEASCRTITDGVVCVGRVTTLDREGNFYRTMFVEDATGGVEVLLGTYDIASQYPEGVEVALRLQGCAIRKRSGVVRVGLPPYSYDTTPREFESQVIIDRHIVRGVSVAPIEPLRTDIASLSTALCGRLVRIEQLHYTPDELSDEVPQMVGYSRFTDGEGGVVYCYVSEYADFANMAVPTTAVALQGVLLYESVGGGAGAQYVIKPSCADDVEAAAFVD